MKKIFRYLFFIFFSLIVSTFLINKSQKVLGAQADSYHYVSPSGNDSNPGTEGQPWKTMDFAVKSLKVGETLFVREGTYETIEDAWRFKDTGTTSNPITVRNYPGEQAIFKINSTRMERRAFRCMYDPNNPSPRQPSPANYIKLLGSNVSSPKVLSNGVSSNKGLVVLGILGANAVGIESIGPHCNNWEVAGFDFIETGGGIFQRNGPSQNWDVHDNRVYNFYRESGMQFNGDNNNVYNNEIYLVNSNPRTYGCQMINLLGHKNTVRNNKLTRAGSTHRCIGVLFEWDLADRNVIEQNQIEDVPVGIGIQGGDRNIIRNNTIIASKGSADIGVNIRSYDGMTGWPCNETGSSFSNLLPPNDPSHPNYEYFYNPRNCHSMYNEISNNVITGFAQMYSVVVPESTNTFTNNTSEITPTGITPTLTSSTCGGLTGAVCPADQFCEYDNGSKSPSYPDASGICKPSTFNCKNLTNGDKCETCAPCPTGSVCPQVCIKVSGTCQNQVCTIVPTATPTPIFCGGIAGLLCPTGLTCVMPQTGGLDLLGHCESSLTGRIKGDADGDGKIDFRDYFYFVSKKHGGLLPANVKVDFNNDALVDGDDRILFIEPLILLLKAIATS